MRNPRPTATRPGAPRILHAFQHHHQLPAVTGQPPACAAQEDGMNAESRRKIQMGASALKFTHAHPDDDPGAATVAAKLEQLVRRSNELAASQRDGIIHQRAASARKTELQRDMLAVPIPHLARVGKVASREQHELGQTFRFKPGATTFLAFRTAARGMASAAEAHKDTLAKHGLVPSVLEEFVRLLDEFDAAVALGNDGRTAHIGATRELKAVAQEIVRTVRVMDGRNRLRFANDGELLGSWLGASRVPRGPRTGTEDEPAAPEAPTPSPTPGGTLPTGGEVRPAA
jgi:hypothetical protein